MKKWRLLALPMVLMLTSCQEVTFGLLWGEKRSAGMDNSSYSYNAVSSISYSYQSNESINTEGQNKTTITFDNIKSSASDIREPGTIASYIQIDSPLFESVTNPEYFGVKADGTVYLGADSSYVIGTLTLNFKENIKNVEITAQPYHYIPTAFNEEEIKVDDEVAISVNNSGFIKLDCTPDLENFTVPLTKCAYHLNEESKSITIRVGKRRAILKEIALYY